MVMAVITVINGGSRGGGDIVNIGGIEDTMDT